MWFALTVLGCVAIVRATHITVVRGHAQGVADAIALAYADRGVTTAEQLAHTLGVSISSVSKDSQGFITVVVRAENFTATSSAG